MDTHHIWLCHVIWYSGFARDGHPIDEPIVHAVRGLSVMDIAELVVYGKIEHSTTNFVVLSTAIPPWKEIFTIFCQISKVEHVDRGLPGRRRENISMSRYKGGQQEERKHCKCMTLLSKVRPLHLFSDNGKINKNICAACCPLHYADNTRVRTHTLYFAFSYWYFFF